MGWRCDATNTHASTASTLAFIGAFILFFIVAFIVAFIAAFIVAFISACSKYESRARRVVELRGVHVHVQFHVCRRGHTIH